MSIKVQGVLAIVLAAFILGRPAVGKSEILPEETTALQTAIDSLPAKSQCSRARLFSLRLLMLWQKCPCLPASFTFDDLPIYFAFLTRGHL